MTADPHGTDSTGTNRLESVPPEATVEPAPASAASVHQGPLRRAWLAWRRWRRSRPFWGGLLIVLGAGEILLSERAPLRAIVHFGAQGLAGYIVPIIMLLCGLLLLVNPQQRLFYSIFAILMSLASWITANLGGFFVGLLLGLVGGSLAFAWTPRRSGRGVPRQSHRSHSPVAEPTAEDAIPESAQSQGGSGAVAAQG